MMSRIHLPLAKDCERERQGAPSGRLGGPWQAAARASSLSLLTDAEREFVSDRTDKLQQFDKGYYEAVAKGCDRREHEERLETGLPANRLSEKRIV